MTIIMEDNCLFCLRLINTTSPESFLEARANNSQNDVILNQLWSFIYHQNVQEANVSSGENISKNGSETCPVLKLSFSLSVCDAKSSENGTITDPVKICTSCSEELNKLEKLRQELENTRKLIKVQIKRIENVWNPKHKDDSTNSILSLLRTFWKPPTMQTSFAGSTMGKDNICKVLKFIGAFCNEVGPSSLTAVPSARPTESIAEEVNERTVMGESQIFEPVTTSEQEDEKSEDTLVSGSLFSTNFENVQTNEIDKVIMEIETEDIKIESVQSVAPPQITKFPVRRSLRSLPHQTLTSQTTTTEVESSSIKKTHIKKQCQTCGKWVASYYFKNHCQIHTGLKPHFCKICNKGFGQKSYYNYHRRVYHHGEGENGNQPKCSICLLNFKYKSSLKLHLERHHKLSSHEIDKLINNEDPDATADREPSVSVPQSCSSSSLPDFRCESKKKSKLCPTCGEWIAAYYFARHQKVHSGKAALKCDRCDAQFKLKSSYTSHMRIKHKIGC